MKILLDGKEFKSHSFADLKPGDVFSTEAGVFIKTPANTTVNLNSGAVENYTGQPITPHPEAELTLED